MTGALLTAARGGDEHAFRELVEPHRRELHAHCYRMLGSVHDAEDAVQETLLRAWRGLPRFEGRSSLRSWLYTIATNTSLKQLERRPRRVLPVDFSPAAEHGAELGPPLAETVWIEPYPSGPEASYEQREALELALIAAVQRLPPGQRAVLLLREVLGFSAAEVAEAIETSVPAVNSSLQRARRALEERLPRQSQQTTLRALGDATVRAVVGGYMDAWQRGDMDAVVAMLAEDAILAMPPTDTWFRGREAVGDFYRRYPGQTTWRHIETSANGQLAVGCYGFIDGAYAPLVIDILTLGADGLISEVTAFLAPQDWVSFGLPETYASSDA
jgi:RNA polymerase sigma-70 factor (ECF subfamily)